MKKPLKLNFPKFESKYAWLAILLNAFYKNDLGVYNELHIYLKKTNHKLACKKGCFNCCLKPMVPISEIELMGISWYLSEMISDPKTRSNLKAQMINHENTFACPFLYLDECAIYPIRPIACRQFYVINRPCCPDENVIETRPEEVWIPSRNVARKTALELLRFYNFNTKKDRLTAFENGFIHQNTRDMHTMDWSLMVENMNRFECK